MLAWVFWSHFFWDSHCGCDGGSMGGCDGGEVGREFGGCGAAGGGEGELIVWEEVTALISGRTNMSESVYTPLHSCSDHFSTSATECDQTKEENKRKGKERKRKSQGYFSTEAPVRVNNVHSARSKGTRLDQISCSASNMERASPRREESARDR